MGYLLVESNLSVGSSLYGYRMFDPCTEIMEMESRIRIEYFVRPLMMGEYTISQDPKKQGPTHDPVKLPGRTVSGHR